jgi:hypothetical protein
MLQIKGCILWCEPHFVAVLQKNNSQSEATQIKYFRQYVVHSPNTKFQRFPFRGPGAEAYGRTDGHGHLPRPTLETLRPLFPRFLYLRPGVTDDCLETRGPWFDAVRGVWCDKLCRSCSLVCGVPWVRCSFVLWNSSMQSRLAIGAL